VRTVVKSMMDDVWYSGREDEHSAPLCLAFAAEKMTTTTRSSRLMETDGRSGVALSVQRSTLKSLPGRLRSPRGWELVKDMTVALCWPQVG